jgi:hypothetical protein
MNHITVKISPTVTQEQQQDIRFQRLLEDATNFFNSPKHFTKKFCIQLCLHEGGHVLYARHAEATGIRFYGPTLYWCSGCGGCTGDTPSISRSSVTWMLPPNCGVTTALKACMGGLVFREVLSDTPNDASAISKDMEPARKWFDDHVGTGEAGFEAAIESARLEIIKDLRSPAFRKLAWDTAREFGREIFPGY